MDFFATLSIIVPLSPRESLWRELAGDLEFALERGAELLLVGCEPRPFGLDVRVGWIESPRAHRAAQLNLGARASRGSQLWFLHADSRLGSAAIVSLERAAGRRPCALYFFDLDFLPDGPRLMRLNVFGARVRARWLKMPFGDQGLSLPRALFDELGAFDERAPYGEDHLLVWRARAAGIDVRATGGVIATSARRYARAGWARTTARTMYLTWKQALPELWRLARSRGCTPPETGVSSPPC